MDDLAKRLARGLIASLDEIELESGMHNWSGIEDLELRGEAMVLYEKICALKTSLRQI